MKILIIPILIAFLLSSCKQTEPISNGETDYQNTAYLTDEIINDFNDPFDDPFNIVEVSIFENTMSLIVNYGGGCSTHEFQLAGSTSVMKSFPPQRSIQLLHNGNNDLCKMLVTDTIFFNIENLSNEKKPGSEIILNLKGWDNSISYTYVKP